MAEYSTYTYGHPSFLVRYPHIKRNRLVAGIVRKLNPSSWLDYGAGDGALIAEMERDGGLPDYVCCFEPEEGMRRELCRTLGMDRADKGRTDENICVTGETGQLPRKRYELITALEVLEHLPVRERIRFYSVCAELLSEGGTCLIEIPVEYGPVLLLKEFGRKYLKGRKSAYSFSELVAAGLFGRVRDVEGRYDCQDSRTYIVPHHGFDLRRLLAELRLLGRVQQVFKSPFTWLPTWMNQTVLFSLDLQVRDELRIRELVEGFCCEVAQSPGPVGHGGRL